MIEYPANIFGAVRKYDIHTGYDLFMGHNAPVYLPFDGNVVKIGNFTGQNAEPTPSPWWNDTQYVIIHHPNDGFVLYGEISASSDIKIGDHLPQGSLIGHIIKVLKNNKGLPTSMLHIELYDHLPEHPAIWHIGEECPTGLLDPKEFAYQFIRQTCT